MVLQRLAIQMLKSMRMHIKLKTGQMLFGWNRRTRFRGRLETGRRTGRSLPEFLRKRGLPGEESPNSAGQCAG